MKETGVIRKSLKSLTSIGDNLNQKDRDALNEQMNKAIYENQYQVLQIVFYRDFMIQQRKKQAQTKNKMQ